MHFYQDSIHLMKEYTNLVFQGEKFHKLDTVTDKVLSCVPAKVASEFLRTESMSSFIRFYNQMYLHDC